MLREVDHAVGTVIDHQERPLVLGGECTVVIGVISAFVRRGIDVGLVYVDGGQDLMIPADHIDEPILDGMGVAHLLGLNGVVDDIAGVGSRRPLLDPARSPSLALGRRGGHPWFSAERAVSCVDGRQSPEATAVAAIAAVPRRRIPTSCTSTLTYWISWTSRQPTFPIMDADSPWPSYDHCWGRSPPIHAVSQSLSLNTIPTTARRTVQRLVHWLTPWRTR